MLISTCLIIIFLAEYNQCSSFTPLIMFCQCVIVPVSKYLLSEVVNISVNIVFEDGSSNIALHCAIWYNKYDKTRLHSACTNGDLSEVLRLVYSSNHNINIQDNRGDNPAFGLLSWLQ